MALRAGNEPATSSPAKGPTADRPVRWRTALVLTALAPLGFALQALASRFPDLTERYYAQGIYPWIEQGLTTLASWSPVAVGESLLLLGLTFVACRLLHGTVALCRGRRRLGNLLLHALAQTGAVSGVLFLLFQLLWAINHARLPFATQVGLRPTAAEPTRLARVAQRLGQRAAAVRPPDLVAGQPFLAADWHHAVTDAYARAGAQLPVLAGPPPVIRSAWISRVMTLGSITGIYSPFTGEPHVNGHVPELVQPFVACHEVAHLRGYAREDEADFIAWWVGSRSPDRTIAYSCELLAFRIAMHELHRADPAAWLRVRAEAPREVLADDAAIEAFWNGQPRTATRVLTTITRTSNDLYLKSSGHPEGVRSYGRMVDLLIAHLDG